MASEQSHPGVFLEEVEGKVHEIEGVPTSITAFVGRALEGPRHKAVSICSFEEFETIFGGLWVESALGYSVRDFYLNGGTEAIIVRLFHPAEGEAYDRDPSSNGARLDESDFIGEGRAGAREGLYALEQVDIFNLLCIPPYLEGGDVDQSVLEEAVAYCEKRRAFLIVDAPSNWKSASAAKSGLRADISINSSNAAIYFPRLRQQNPLRENEVEEFAACGAVAGVIARTDRTHGVWKAPAGLEANLNGVDGLSLKLTDEENAELNPLGINCLRTFPSSGHVVWGARTLAGSDAEGSEWKYIPVRRMAIFLEESIDKGTQWAVYEPNDEPLWARLRSSVGKFMQSLFQEGAFQGGTPRDAYFVKCDGETTTQEDIDRGVVNMVVGFAPIRPSEFVTLRIQQRAGRTQPKKEGGCLRLPALLLGLGDFAL